MTWLAPGLPLGLFELVVGELGTTLDVDVALTSRTDRSGPPADDDPFARDEVDVGFMCAPSYRDLTSVELLVAPVFTDSRAGHRPVYFSELVVRSGVTASALHDLAGRRVGYNDAGSLSGYGALVEHLESDAVPVELVHTGGHLASLEMLGHGAIDAAAIDSNTLAGRGGLPDGLRVIETWGPYPTQPVVARRTLEPQRRADLRAALVSMTDSSGLRGRLREFGVECFTPVTDAEYRVVNWTA